ncbi:hypothetical protein [Rhizobium leguminosarum]|uniref:Uncharacterized protein n=1 Tax=Rhizobium leguminosarum TaxID=384 RepID=A0A6P0BIN8_RHILE|nr:hypothetical protein [Rhizobium leguminosarum]MBY5441806.1 hypothetical protein [Rhizobium leguminosarum]NEI39046.1 hypothetical protein [Rhizobium leguminosarum]NEI45789.1 hypothetical protein [Rhizobium leguminosarum]
MTGPPQDDWRKPASVDYALDEPKFMAEYGRSMAAWGNVEHALSSVFATVLDVTQVHHARAAFHSVISFRDRLGMIDAPMKMVTTSFPGKQWVRLNQEWVRLSDAVNKASRHRNLLAHMHVWHSPLAGTFGWKNITRISDLPIEPDERKKVTVTVERMRDYRKSFENCTHRIRDFEQNLLEAMKDPMRDVILPSTQK